MRALVSTLTDEQRHSVEWKVRTLEQLLALAPRDRETFMDVLFAALDASHAEGLKRAAGLVADLAKGAPAHASPLNTAAKGILRMAEMDAR